VADAVTNLQATELERAREIWRKKFGAPPADTIESGRQMRFLLSRGFTAEVVGRVVKGRDD
jgi:regulatory protein